MTVEMLLPYVTRTAFILLFLISLRDYFHHAGHIRRDIALMFGTIAVTSSFQIMNTLLPSPLLYLTSLGSILLMAQPYLMLRLLAYFQETSKLLQRAAIIAMSISALIILIYGSKLPPVFSLGIVLYFALFNIYTMQGFIRRANTTTGVSHQRLRFTAIGAGLFALALLIAGLSVLFSSISPILSPITQIIAVASAVSFYLGLTPFRWLRQSWQLSVLKHFITDLNNITASMDLRAVHELLLQGAREATGANTVKIALWNHENDDWTFAFSQEQLDKSLFATASQFGNAWQQCLTLTAKLQDLSMSEINSLHLVRTKLLYFVPIVRNRQKWGMLIVQLEHGSLFIDDDLSLLNLFVEQTAIVLENIGLINEISQHAHLLEVTVEQRTAELKQLNQELEQRVEERTIHLSAVNKELEAFSYSVSHDLRAPLRAIDGFSQVLLEDYELVLDHEGKDYLGLIRSESQRMGLLIDDLINLSRFTRDALVLAKIDLSLIAQEVSKELQSRNPQRDSEFLIHPNLFACADQALIRIVLNNLIGNAWKYSRPKPLARIEFGANYDNQEMFYFVRDNGVGFDMAYAHKLFGAFQRLHGVTEFEGTGIGLATVQRIIHRHGGKVWADAKLNEGSCFYFTLGNYDCD